MSWRNATNAALADLATSRQLRRRRVAQPIDAVRVLVDGRPLVNFCSNDYLGLSHHPAVVEAARSAAKQYGAGSGAAPLVTGYTEAHARAEAAVARWKGVEAAVLLPSGYQANAAAVQAVAALATRSGEPPSNVERSSRDERTDFRDPAESFDGGRPPSDLRLRFVADKLVHASLVDALRSARQTTGVDLRFYPHNHQAKLRRLVSTDAARLTCIVTESVFSMDGDTADLRSVCDARARAQGRAMILLDEAHGSGVFGAGGAGLASQLGLTDAIDLSVVTFSKAVGVAGGAVCGSTDWCQAVISLGRSYLFSTSPPASTAAAIEASIAVLQTETDRQGRLRERCERVRRALTTMKLLPAGGWEPGGEIGPTPIFPIVLGEETAALAASRSLADEGYFVAAIRPPTVPRGTSRLRLTLSSEHTDAQIDGLLSALTKLDLATAER